MKIAGITNFTYTAKTDKNVRKEIKSIVEKFDTKKSVLPLEEPLEQRIVLLSKSDLIDRINYRNQILAYNMEVNYGVKK